MNKLFNIQNPVASFIPFKKDILRFTCSVLLFLILFTAAAQDKKTALQEKKRKLLEEIEFTQKTLTKTKASKEATLADLQALSKQIELRQKLIKLIS